MHSLLAFLIVFLGFFCVCVWGGGAVDVGGGVLIFDMYELNIYCLVYILYKPDSRWSPHLAGRLCILGQLSRAAQLLSFVAAKTVRNY